MIAAQGAIAALLPEGAIDRLCKALRLYPKEIKEWENNPEGRYETDLAKRSPLEASSPCHCGCALRLTLLD
jgi:hypothetical protein